MGCLMADGPGNNDSLMRFSNEEAGQRYAVALAESHVEKVRFLVFDALSDSTTHLRHTLVALVTTFGKEVLPGTVVVATKPDVANLMGGPKQIEMRLAGMRELMREQNIPECQLITWNGRLKDAEAVAQFEMLSQLLVQVPCVALSSLTDLKTRQRKCAEQLHAEQKPRSKRISVEVEHQEPYETMEATTVPCKEAYEESYEEIEKEIVVNKVEHQEPYETVENDSVTCTEEYLEPYEEIENEIVMKKVDYQEPYETVEYEIVTVQETHQEPYESTKTETYTEWERYSGGGSIAAGIFSLGISTAFHNGRNADWREVTRTRQVPVTKFRTVTRDVQKSVPKTVIKHRTVIRDELQNVPKTVTKHRTLTREVLKTVPKTVMQYRTVTRDELQTVPKTVTKSRTLYRDTTKTVYVPVTKYHAVTKTEQKDVEYLLPIEDFMESALQQILREVRSTFSAKVSR